MCQASEEGVIRLFLTLPAHSTMHSLVAVLLKEFYLGTEHSVVPHEVLPRADDPRVSAVVERDGPVERVRALLRLRLCLGLDLDAPLDGDLCRC